MDKYIEISKILGETVSVNIRVPKSLAEMIVRKWGEKVYLPEELINEACDILDDLDGLSDKEGVGAADVDPDELEMGLKVEQEHTSDKKVALRICLDHLTENPKYYSYLKQMENQAKKDGNQKNG